MQFGTRARPPFADRGGRSGGGNGVAGSNCGGSRGHWGNGHHGRRGSPSGRSPRDDSRRHLKRGGFSPRPTPRFHTNNVSVPKQGDDAAVRQIVQANSASPHFVGAAINPSAKGKGTVQSPPTVSRKHIDYLVQLQRTMKELFDRLDFEPTHELHVIAYANFINNQAQKRTGSITPWINFVPWSKHAWLWSEFIAAPPDPPDAPGISEVSLDEVHAAFAATLPALTVSDTACAQVDAAAAAFADSVSDAINIASRAASALDATS
jgi:hypothetical protein